MGRFEKLKIWKEKTSWTRSEHRGGTFWDGGIIYHTVHFMLIFFFLSKFLKQTKPKKKILKHYIWLSSRQSERLVLAHSNAVWLYVHLHLVSCSPSSLQTRLTSTSRWHSDTSWSHQLAKLTSYWIFSFGVNSMWIECESLFQLLSCVRTLRSRLYCSLCSPPRLFTNTIKTSR